jgi:glyoxalase family protein
MRLEGIHHITAITADARRNLDFYVRVLGLRFVKKTVNFDQPDAYHLYYADEHGTPGSVLTFFEFPGAAPGRAGQGMAHRVGWSVGSRESLDFWAERLAAEGVDAVPEVWGLRFADPEGLELELGVGGGPGAPLSADADDIPAEHRLLGFAGVRAYSDDPDPSAALLGEALGFEGGPREWMVTGEDHYAAWGYDPPPPEPGIQGAGTVHHVAWASRDEDHERWRTRAADAGARVTPVIDRDYFRSIYFREPSGVLFEIATSSPGFAVDEDHDRLGEELRLPAQHEHLRGELEESLTPLTNPRPRGGVR